MKDKVTYLHKTEKRKKEFEDNLWNYQMEIATVIESYYDKGVDLRHLLIVLLKLSGSNLGLGTSDMDDIEKSKFLEGLIATFGEDYLKSAFGEEFDEIT